MNYGLGNKIIPYKGRKINMDKPVLVYRNLHQGENPNKKFSIKQNGLVVGHTNCITLGDCKFIVSKAGQQRVRREKRKNVHAWIKGFICPQGVMRTNAATQDSLGAKITYNPYEDKAFVCKNLTIKPYVVKEAMGVLINNKGVTAAYTS